MGVLPYMVCIGDIHYVKCIMSCICDEINKVQITMLGSI